MFTHRSTYVIFHLKQTTTLWGIRCENKFYQLEEMEDKDTATTELFLRDDNWIDFGDSDGPVAAQVDGYWSVAPGTDDFEMTVKRVFVTGSDNTDMGEFTFEVIRKYVGQMTLVGESVAITGVMLNVDEVLGDEEVGFFNMIDGTNERQGYENQSVRATGY